MAHNIVWIYVQTHKFHNSAPDRPFGYDGHRKIIKAMAANGSPAPEFETDEDRSYFLIRLPVHEKAATWVEEVIIALISANGQITIPEMAVQLGVTERSVERNIQKLRDAGAIRRIGFARGGVWEAVE